MPTPNFALPYPVSTDPADVPADVKRLADRLDALLTPVGSPIAWLASAVPAGFVEFAGQAISAATYPKLFALFGATMPDLRGRFLYGQTGARPVGSTGGAEQVALTLASIPSHSHSIGRVSNATAFGGGVVPGSTNPAADLTDQESGLSGGSGAHENMPPYRAVRWITVAG